MPSPSPIVRKLLILWIALWVLDFLLGLNDGMGLAAWLWLDPQAVFAGELRAIPGLLGYALVHAPRQILHVA